MSQSGYPWGVRSRDGVPWWTYGQKEGVQLSGISVGLGGAQRWKYLVHRYFKEVLMNLISCH